MMRLTKNNIEAVKQVMVDDTTATWYVCMKSGWVSDMRMYAYSNISRYSKPIDFPVADLPKTVQEFIKEHRCILTDIFEEPEFTIAHYTYA